MTDNHLTRFLETAEDCLGTPFHHQGREMGAGLDCIGLVVVCLKSIGYSVVDRTDYERRPDGTSLLAALTAHNAQQVDTPRPGDILVFRFDHQPQHVAIAVSETDLIHSFAPAGRVVRSAIGAYWRRRLVGIYRFPLEGTQER